MAEYYIRWRGKVSGPFPVADIGKMLKAGRLGKHHQVSTDASDWGRLSEAPDFSEYFVLPARLAPQAPPAPPAPPPAAGPAAVEAAPEAAEEEPEVRAGLIRLVQDVPASVAGTADEDAGGPAVVKWYVARDGKTCGPFAQPGVERLVRNGEMTAESLVCKEGEVDWRPLATAPEFASALGAGGAGAGVADSLEYAGFWRRVGAAVIDNILLFAGGAALGVILGALAGALLAAVGKGAESMWIIRLLAQAVSLLANWLYFTCLECSASQATLGKSVMGLAVTDLDGRRISFGKANGRYWSKVFSCAILCIGFLMAAFTERKQCLHDIVAGTLVIRR